MCSAFQSGVVRSLGCKYRTELRKSLNYGGGKKKRKKWNKKTVGYEGKLIFRNAKLIRRERALFSTKSTDIIKIDAAKEKKKRL